jgi:hypothetical protein
METQHTESVIEKALAFVKHTLGIRSGDQTLDVVANPEYTDTAPEPNIEGAMRLDPYTFKSIGELHIEKAANDDEHPNPAELHADVT